MHATQRTDCAPQDAPVCASKDAPVARRKTCRVCAPEDAPSALEDALFTRREMRRSRAGRRAVRAPGNTSAARHMRARARSFFFRRGGRGLEVVVRRDRRVADGAVSPSRLGRAASLSPLAATGSNTQHLSQSRGAPRGPSLLSKSSV